MKKIFQKLLSSILIISIVSLNFTSIVRADDLNSETSNQSVEVTATPEPTSTQSEGNEAPSDPTPTIDPTPTAVPTPTKIPEPGDPNRTHSASSAFAVGVNPTPTSAPTPVPSSTNNNTGDTSIKTGDALSTASVANTGNNNLSDGSSASIGATDEGAVIVNEGNGSNSSNSGSATLNNGDNTNQNNSANVNTNLNQSSTTGSNSASYNVGGHSNITTGDANTTGTVITSVNTNVDGVMVSEFNVVDDHIGDILLDFSSNCISGCVGEPLKVANTGNGSNSNNTGSVANTNENNTFQTNDAVIGANLNLSADSGNNTSSYNVGGDSNITTGDANVEANVLTFANNNIAGDVVYAVVNIFGDLIGDILFPEEFMTSCCGVSPTASNVGNGSDSVNNANIDTQNSENTFQNNEANIVNELIFDATTGENETSRNTGGDSSITTGNTSVDANVLNVANSNITDGNMWLVLINEAGNWIGKILGSPDNSNFAGSSGTEFTVDENGFITASNAGNGENTDNVSDIVLNNTDNTTQNNTADIHNTLNLSANTGGNQASNNTGGDSNIKTGDAKIVANLVNFVNNNIKGNGKLFVTVVNVFGSWFGDFVSPGQTKQSKTDSSEQNTGGPNASTNSSSQTANSKVSATSNTASTDNIGATTVIVTPKAKTTFFAFSNPVNSEKGKNTQKALVKGISANSINTLGVSDNDGKIKINLAWLAFILPLVVFGFSFKKLILPKINRKI